MDAKCLWTRATKSRRLSHGSASPNTIFKLSTLRSEAAKVETLVSPMLRILLLSTLTFHRLDSQALTGLRGLWRDKRNSYCKHSIYTSILWHLTAACSILHPVASYDLWWHQHSFGSRLTGCLVSADMGSLPPTTRLKSSPRDIRFEGNAKKHLKCNVVSKAGKIAPGLSSWKLTA